jgi:glucose/arabinose dehydrogenase
MVWGPDDKLYVAEMFGKIHRITLSPAKTVVSDEVINTLGSRLTLGLTVDPASTPSNVILWASNSSPSTDNGVANSSAVTRLSGPNLGIKNDVITGLPRAIANHAINGIHFAPDGKLYIAIGGNTGAGAPNTDSTEFGNRAEQPLSAALLVADVKAPGFDGTCENTSDFTGPAPCDVKTFSTGLRNMYDFAIHSNGSIYGPVNGLGVAGSYPPSPAAPCTGLGSTTAWNAGGNNPGTQPDILVQLKQGRYYGHPNPSRGECVFFDGHYQGVPPLSNYTPPILNLGSNKSADGTIEYRGDSFCGQLKGNLLLANYSSGDDITRVQLSADGTSVTKSESLVGGFKDPLALAQSPDGTIFVAELGAYAVTALKPLNPPSC